MKICINREPRDGPWGGGNLFVREFCEYFTNSGHKVVFKLSEDVDCLFIQDPRYGSTDLSIREIAAFKASKPSTKIFHRVNECDARKKTTGMDALLRDCSLISDHTFFVSNWIRDYHIQQGWGCAEHSVVYNGVNTKHFKPSGKINNKKTNIVTHHWSDNEMKGLDYYLFLDEFVGFNDNFTFTYIGRCKEKFKNSKIIAPLYGARLGAELAKYDVYVSGTRYDPGPNHIIESIASGLPTFVFSLGGGAVEFAGPRNSFDNPTQLVKLLQSDYSRVTHDYKVMEWKEQLQKVLNVIESAHRT